MKTKCSWCKKDIERPKYLVKKRNCYCNASCQMYYAYKNGIRNGQKITEKAHETLRKKGHYKRDNSYLFKCRISDEARKKLSESRKGKGNPMYKKKPWNKLTPTKKWWEESEFVRLRKKCLKRDKNQCVKCGKKNVDLYCDHIIPYRVCKEHKLENLQMLCGSCHSKKTFIDVKKYSLNNNI